MFVNANGVELHVQRLGQSGPIVVMLHGAFVGNLATWWLTGGPALAADHRVILYDLRGHGRSQRATSGYGVPNQVADLRALLGALDISEPVALVGHSFGAVIALAYTLSHPGSVSRLALVDPPLQPTDPDAVSRFLNEARADAMAALPESLREGAASLPAGEPPVGRRSRRLWDSVHFLGAETDLPAALTPGWDTEDSVLRTLQVPTLLVGGTRSPCLVAVERLSRVLPQAHTVRLDSGHFIPVEAAAPLSQVLVSFLRVEGDVKNTNG